MNMRSGWDSSGRAALRLAWVASSGIVFGLCAGGCNVFLDNHDIRASRNDESAMQAPDSSLDAEPSLAPESQSDPGESEAGSGGALAQAGAEAEEDMPEKSTPNGGSGGRMLAGRGEVGAGGHSAAGRGAGGAGAAAGGGAGTPVAGQRGSAGVAGGPIAEAGAGAGGAQGGSGGVAQQGGAGAAGTDPPQAGSPADDCMTRITYGAAWILPADHPNRYDDVSGIVSWDGTCEIDAVGNSVATLSNGWHPFFMGTTACVIALDVSGSCAPAATCATRVSYGSAWSAPADHPNRFDDVDGMLTTDGVCNVDGASSYMILSNGWRPYFVGTNGCALALRHTQCGGFVGN